MLEDAMVKRELMVAFLRVDRSSKGVGKARGWSLPAGIRRFWCSDQENAEINWLASAGSSSLSDIRESRAAVRQPVFGLVKSHQLV